MISSVTMREQMQEQRAQTKILMKVDVVTHYIVLVWGEDAVILGYFPKKLAYCSVDCLIVRLLDLLKKAFDAIRRRPLSLSCRVLVSSLPRRCDCQHQRRHRFHPSAK